MPVRYRVAGEDDWRIGEVENISRSGVLFRAESTLKPETAIVMAFVLPVETVGAPASVVCRGRVVRTGVHEPENGVAIAATIERYRFERNAGAS